MNQEEIKTARLALKTARQAAFAAGEVIRSRSGTAFRVDRKGAADLVTEVDLAAEKVIISLIAAAFPDHRIAAEESGRKDGDSRYIWWIDPIDGTTNFVHGYPFYSVSIALEYQGVMVAGVVYDPVAEEMFEALRSGGARLNGREIAVSEVPDLDNALLATGFPYERGDRQRALEIASGFLPRIQGLRRDGSAALDLAYVAAGRLDGFWEQSLKPWDIAAGLLLVEEAGGRVSDFSGKKIELQRGEIVASGPGIHLELVAGLNQK